MDPEPGFSGSLSIDRPSSPLSSRSSTPFQFPFPPLALFDSDTSSRLLTLLQHQNLLTEESLRSKSLFGDTRSLYLLTKDGFRFNHLFADDILTRKSLLPDTAVRNRTPEEDVRPNLLSQENLSEDRNKSGEETVRCSICSAFFPSAWLLEQHTALQHLPLGQLPDDKPFICDQCGQSYRYRSAYVKHREQNHRARLPADKLFTCDVCGMQFRYLKSFKKHRLNHALERLHGKSDMFFANDRPENSNARMFMMMRPDLSSKSTATVQTVTENSNDQVSSSNEAIPLGNSEIDLTISKVKEEEEPVAEEMSDNAETKKSQISDCDQDDTIDSMSLANPTDGSSKTDQNLTDKEPSINFPNADSSISDGSNAKTTILRKILRPDLDRKSVGDFSHLTADSSNVDFRKQETFVASLLNADSSILSETMRASQESIRNLNAQEASILNFLRVDAVERQRERRFACPFCGKCVRSKENLKLHVRKHTGERPFVCLFCGRAFGGKSDLTRHLRIHTGERPYHCEACGKCFARADYLSKHLTTHIHNTSR